MSEADVIGDGVMGAAGGASRGPGRSEERQLLLFPDAASRAPEETAALLAARLGAPVRLTATRNRTSVLTFKRAKGGGFDLRMHAVFVDAPDEVLDAIALFLTRPVRAARDKVAAFFQASRAAAPREPRPAASAPQVRTKGRVFDLGEVFQALNARYFGGRIASRISWGASRRGGPGDATPAEAPGDLEFVLEPAPAEAGRARQAGPIAARTGGRGRTIRFGSYLADQDLIRIHPALDAAWVPRYFLESIVYHEMLHAVIPIAREESGRRCVHSDEFRRREREFHAFGEALDWERTNLPRLLGARP